MPSLSRSPTGRMPQERSRTPRQVSGLTAISVPPTESVPVQRPVWASRWVSKTTLPRLRRYWRGSAMAGVCRSHVTSIATLCSVGSTTTRRRRSGSSTSMRNGPTESSARSVKGADARTMCCSSPRRTSMKASTTPRLGYWPNPKMANQSPVHGCKLK